MRMQTEANVLKLNPEIEAKTTAQRSYSEHRLIKLEKIGFEIEAEKIRKENSNINLLREYKMRSKSNKKVLPQLVQHEVGHFLSIKLIK